MEGKFASLYPLLSRESVFNEPDFEADFEGNIEYIGDEARVLVVGAGGLGCELLKNLALSGFTDIHLIDLDTIDVSNLNRQFLFRKKDVGRSKAEVAAEFIQQRCKGVKVTSYNRPIQEFRREWYRNFDIIIAGLDNVEARKWLNETLCDLVRLGPDGSIDYDTVIPLIDGGTEGFGGQARLFLPRMSSCFECSLDSLPAGNNHFHLCTIANIPRIPEHCIAWALYLRWPLLCEFNSVDDYKLYEAKDPDDKNPDPVKLDKDDEVHLSWIYNQALGRAQEHGIKVGTASVLFVNLFTCVCWCCVFMCL